MITSDLDMGLQQEPQESVSDMEAFCCLSYHAATLNLGNKKIRIKVLGVLAHVHNYCTFSFI